VQQFARGIGDLLWSEVSGLLLRAFGRIDEKVDVRIRKVDRDLQTHGCHPVA
jgi:hypothetical protein